MNEPIVVLLLVLMYVLLMLLVFTLFSEELYRPVYDKTRSLWIVLLLMLLWPIHTIIACVISIIRSALNVIKEWEDGE